MAVKSFIGLAPGVNVKKILHRKMKMSNKLVKPGKRLQPCLIFESKDKAFPS
jgi:hypothetical protein